MSEIRRLGIVGAGAWGTALAHLLGRAGRAVRLWAYEPEVVHDINRAHENRRYLPGIALECSISASAELGDLVGADLLVLAVPAQHLRGVLKRYARFHRPGTPAVIAAKGIERDACAFLSDVVRAELPRAPLAVLSGPTFAAEVARGLPTAVTLACADLALGEAIAAALGSATFRPYLTDDLRGAEVGGAVKNVLAIACGIALGRRLGDNARAALITRGFAEMTRLGAALGARPETLTGLAGLGDLVLTCTSTQSRNTSLGLALGRGERLDEVERSRPTVAEGVATAPALVALARAKGVEMPIAEAVNAILHMGADIDERIGVLLARPFTTEAGFVPGKQP